MATAEQALAHYGATIQQARDFIFSSTNQPSLIFETAEDFDITTPMLSEITGYSTVAIENYFATYGLDAGTLDNIKIFFNSDPSSVAYLIDFNDQTGNLSTTSLREQVKPLIEKPIFYDNFFSAVTEYQDDDGIYTPDESGISHLGNVKATNENIESIFFGTLLNIYKAIDSTELDELIKLPDFNGNNEDEITGIVDEALRDLPAIPHSDSYLTTVVTNAAVQMIENYWSGVGARADDVGILAHQPFLQLLLFEF